LNCGVVANASVLKNRAGVRCSGEVIQAFDHDVGRLNQGGSRVTFLQTKFADGIRCNDGG